MELVNWVPLSVVRVDGNPKMETHENMKARQMDSVVMSSSGIAFGNLMDVMIILLKPDECYSFILNKWLLPILNIHLKLPLTFNNASDHFIVIRRHPQIPIYACAG